MSLLCVVAPALAVNGPSLLPQLNREEELEEQQSLEQPPGVLDGILWMAVPKKRRTIEVNRTRRRAQEKLLKVKVHLIRATPGSSQRAFSAPNPTITIFILTQIHWE